MTGREMWADVVGAGLLAVLGYLVAVAMLAM